MQTMDGALTAVDEDTLTTSDPTDEAASMCHDMQCILVDCSRDRAQSVFRDDATREAIYALADTMARRLALRIGGRYVPKRDSLAARDAAVWQAIRSGRNREKVMRDFVISQRLYYSIKARMRKVGGSGSAES